MMDVRLVLDGVEWEALCDLYYNSDKKSVLDINTFAYVLFTKTLIEEHNKVFGKGSHLSRVGI